MAKTNNAKRVLAIVFLALVVAARPSFADAQTRCDAEAPVTVPISPATTTAELLLRSGAYAPFVAADDPVSIKISSPLHLSVTCVDRTQLPNGSQVIRVIGRVTNPTPVTQNVPPLDAFVRSRSGQVVHTWTITPPTTVLAPGANATFDSSETDVPPGGDDLTITLRDTLPLPPS